MLGLAGLKSAFGAPEVVIFCDISSWVRSVIGFRIPKLLNHSKAERFWRIELQFNKIILRISWGWAEKVFYSVPRLPWVLIYLSLTSKTLLCVDILENTFPVLPQDIQRIIVSHFSSIRQISFALGLFKSFGINFPENFLGKLIFLNPFPMQSYTVQIIIA